MTQNKTSKSEVTMAGTGGMGVLVAGQILATAAFQQFEHISYVPAYGFAMRGGPSECTVIFSDNKISSPLLNQAQVVIIIDSSQFGAFEPRVRPGGIIIAEKSGLPAERNRDDYKIHALSGLEIATSIGSRMVNNMVMLGAYVTISESLQPVLIENELNRRYSKNDKILGRNLEAFRRGLELGKAVT